MDRAFRAIRRCDVVALVIDAVDGITQQDFRCRSAPLCTAPPPPPPTHHFCLPRARPRSWRVVTQLPVVSGREPCRLAELVQAEGRACVIIVNKWDLVPDKAHLPPPPLSSLLSSPPGPQGGPPRT